MIRIRAKTNEVEMNNIARINEAKKCFLHKDKQNCPGLS